MNWQRTIGLLLLGLGMAVATLKYSVGQDLGPNGDTGSWPRGEPQNGARRSRKPEPAKYLTWGLMGVPGILGISFLLWGVRAGIRKHSLRGPPPAPARFGNRRSRL